MNLTTCITGVLATVLAAVYFLYQVEAKKVERRDALIAAHQAVEKMTAVQIQQDKIDNDANVAENQRLRDELARQQAIAVKAERARRALDFSTKQALKRIANAPTTDDGPVAPVLRTELDSLRAPAVDGQPGTADSPNAGGIGHPDDTADPGMPPAPPAS